MATKVQVTGGVLEVEAIIGTGLHPDAGLPIAPVRPGQLPSSDLHPWVPGNLPDPPANVFPPLTPSHPIQPAPPGTPPGTIWPPVVHPGHPSQGLPIAPGHPDQGLPPAPVRPGQGLPPAPARPDQGLPPTGATPTPPIESKTYWLVCGIPGVGWRYVAIDPSLTVGHPLPPAPAPKA